MPDARGWSGLVGGNRLSTLEARVAEVMASALERNPGDFKPTDTLRKDLGIDSVDLLGLVGELEDAFGIRFPSDPELMTNVETVADLVAMVAGLLPK